jgi:hypothetical protein
MQKPRWLNGGAPVQQQVLVQRIGFVQVRPIEHCHHRNYRYLHKDRKATIRYAPKGATTYISDGCPSHLLLLFPNTTSTYIASLSPSNIRQHPTQCFSSPQPSWLCSSHTLPSQQLPDLCPLATPRTRAKSAISVSKMSVWKAIVP